MADITRRRFIKVGVVGAGTLAVTGGGIASATYAPEAELVRERMGSGMSKVLVAYATKSGSVCDIAAQIGETLSAGGAQVDVKPVDDAPSAAAYDAVIVGSGVRAGNWHGGAKTWVADNAHALKSKPTAFFTVGLRITEPDQADEVRAYTDPLIAETGVKPLDVGLFAGWFEPKKFSFVERSILKMMKTPEGDKRDLGQVAAWTTEVAPKLGMSAG